MLLIGFSGSWSEAKRSGDEPGSPQRSAAPSKAGTTAPLGRSIADRRRIRDGRRWRTDNHYGHPPDVRRPRRGVLHGRWVHKKRKPCGPACSKNEQLALCRTKSWNLLVCYREFCSSKQLLALWFPASNVCRCSAGCATRSDVQAAFVAMRGSQP
jgi:hypothetical protein